MEIRTHGMRKAKQKAIAKYVVYENDSQEFSDNLIYIYTRIFCAVRSFRLRPSSKCQTRGLKSINWARKIMYFVLYTSSIRVLCEWDFDYR